MLEKKFTNMENLSRAQTLLNRQQFSVERKPIIATNAGKLSDTAPSFSDIRESTMERDRMSVMSVGKALGEAQILPDTRESTLAKDPLNAQNVDEHSA